MLQFESLPRPARQIAFAAYGWRQRALRFQDEYQEWRQFLRNTTSWDEAAQAKWQLHSLKELLNSAIRNVPHYRSLRIDQTLVRSGESLRELLDALPILQKQQLRTHPERFRNASVPELLTTSTSGSTGSPMTVGHGHRSLQRRFAIQHDHLARTSTAPNSRSVRLSGRIICAAGVPQRKPWLTNFAENQLFLSSYHLDEDHAKRIARKLHSFRPVLMDGYPSAIRSTLRLLSGVLESPLELRTIVTTAETLHPDLREELENLSGARVLDYYAASEGLPYIQQCLYGTYHVRWQSGIFEVDLGDRFDFEGDGELICTSFVQERTPLIRYRTGDLVQGLRMTNDCPCGLRSPRVAAVLGRVEDMVYTRDGRALGMFTYRTLKLIPNLGETQVIQRTPVDFLVRTATPMSSETATLEADIKASFERVLGHPIEMTLERVDRLPLGANGKVRLVVSEVRPARSVA